MSNKKQHNIKIGKAKGRPMLSWVGKRPLTTVKAYPAQAVESFNASPQGFAGSDAYLKHWPDQYPPGGLLFHGDNKDVLAHLLANGFRGKVKLIYIDPPFDSGADYVRKVQLRGVSGSSKVDGEEYTLGEQIQYEDIWANDNYLQFMYERLLMLKELLAEDGAIWLHCDTKKSHYLKILMDEVFGVGNFRNEICWQRSAAHSDATTYSNLHDLLFFYTKSNLYIFNQQFIPYSEKYITERYKHEDDGRKYMDDNLTATGLKGGGYAYSWKGVTKSWRCPESTMVKYERRNKLHYSSNGTPRLKRYLDEMKGLPISDLWTDIKPVNSQAKEREDYPTQKSERLINRIINTCSKADDIILDCFIGSGTTAAVAQKLGRRWIGCDINKGAIQTTAKRLQTIMRQQAAELDKNKQTSLIDEVDAAVTPAQLNFSTHRVNDYDLQIQHNEAVQLACDYIGITRSRSDSYFDGLLGSKLVKIIPFNHPLSPLDLQDLRNELQRRPDEEREITLVCLGLELKARSWVDDYNRNRPVNQLNIIELRNDRKYGGFIKHEPMTALVDMQRTGEKVHLSVKNVFSPAIVQRLNLDDGLFTAQIEDWRAMVDCVMIDSAYDGNVFNVVLSDVPPRKQDLVTGDYELQNVADGALVAVKIIDMLGEEVIVSEII